MVKPLIRRKIFCAYIDELQWTAKRCLDKIIMTPFVGTIGAAQIYKNLLAELPVAEILIGVLKGIQQFVLWKRI